MTGRLDREEFLAGFLAEADELLRGATSNLLALEAAARRGEGQGRLVRELFRALHTLKGLSAMVDVEPVVALAHEMEGALREADRSGRPLSLEAIDTLLTGLRAIEPRVRAVADRQVVPAAPPSLVAALADLQAGATAAPAPAPAALPLEPELLSKLTAAEVGQLAQASATARRAVRLEFVPAPERAARGVTITSVREALGRLGDLVRVLPRAVPAGAAAPGGLAFVLLLVTGASDAELAAAAEADPGRIQTLVAPGAPAPPAPPPVVDDIDDEEPAPGRARGSYVRVDVARLDDALERLSDLVVTRFRLVRAAAALRERGADVRELQTIIQETSRQLRDLRASIMRARLVSVGELLERVPLLVRGLGQRTGKAVRLEVDAGRAELDKAVAERIFPAIVHLVRNAVDHALEPAEERRAAGKPPEGLLRVTCHRRTDGFLELDVTDDGRGVDAAALARRAGAPVPQDPDALLDLLCRAGLSTHDAATETSGRGMGMDIVRRIVQGLGGEVRLATRPGAGTTFTLRVPLSISILDAFTFECAGQPFVVPVAVVEEILAVDPARLVATPGGGARLLERRGEVVPLVPLAQVFGFEPGPGGKALVVRRGGAPFAFAVDRMLGQQEVVLRPLEDPLVRVRGVAGTTDLGDGLPTLVLDLVALSAAATAGEAA
ncbi:MAG: chemotaxis protein CheW [Planctomycetes bacterium]|nr:chemotaxis protein CheW [Planctomycetota bacterium]